MKQLLLLGAALALVGCNSAPSEGDIEDFLESRFAPCKNIKVVDITKTNGYEQDGYYRVEFAYSLELKDAKALRAAKARWQEENDTAEKAFLEKWPGYRFQRKSPNDAIYNFYFAGCSSGARQLMPNYLEVHSRGFSEDDMEMTGTVLMHKTENGWRALSGS